jgi:hypothetical protein
MEKSETINVFESITSKHLEDFDVEASREPTRITVSFRTDVYLVGQIDELANRLNMTRSAALNQILDSGVADALNGYFNVVGRDGDQVKNFHQAATDRSAELVEKERSK